MKNNFSHKTVLILGGPGLVGRNVTQSLVARGTRRISVVGLPREAGWRELRKIEHQHHVRIQKYSVNLLLPPQLQRHSFDKVLSSPRLRQNLVRTVSQDTTDNEVARQPIAKIVNQIRPHIIVDCINTATQCAYIDQANDRIRDAGIGLLLLLRYYRVLFRLLQKNSKSRVEQYLKVGTTGIGGMGLDIPFTHGEERPSISLMKKVAMAGVQTNLLLAMRHSRNITNVQEIVPATAIFQLSGFMEKESSGKTSPPVEIDGGESRGYTLEEFRLLSNKKEMGAIDATELAEVIVKTLQTGRSRFDVLRSLDRAGIGSTSRSTGKRKSILTTWHRALSSVKTKSIAHGNLGPWRTRKLLFEATLMLSVAKQEGKKFWSIPPKDIQSSITVMLKNDKALYREIQFANLTVTKKTPSSTVSDQRIDISLGSLRRWQRLLKTLGSRDSQAGDILADAIQKQHDLRAIP